ncbi:MAG: GNAT family N-acetyltransferase [Firmicutes bacterium]|nr:GNAT family N-acetyltransferase [Bacillota bacterium]
MKYYVAKEYAGYGCHADDFLSNDNKVVLANESDEDFYGMMCFKNAVLVKAKKEVFEWSKRFVSQHVGFRCFDFQQVAALYQELLRHGYSMQGGQGLLPDMTQGRRVAPETGFHMRVFQPGETMQIYNHLDKDDWHMTHPSDETALTIAAFEGDRIVGLCDADSDTDTLWSVGVEVLPAYRCNGIAAALTAEMTNLLLGRRVIPFATGAWSNNASRTTLYKCGYYPAWSGLGSCDSEWALNMLNDSVSSRA